MKDQSPAHQADDREGALPSASLTSAVAALERRNAELEMQVVELKARIERLTSAPGPSPSPAEPELTLIDPVTGLPNRLCFQDRLANAVRYSERFSLSFAVLFIDLDDFKTVNDTMGHSAGDDLLRDIAERLSGCVRASDTVARLGGDEFTIVLLNLREPELVARVAEKIISTLSEPFSIGGRDFFLSASIGIAAYPQDGTDVELLVRNADTAMYEVKHSGKNGYHFYTRAMSERAIARLELEDELRQAIREQQLAIHYQPTVDADSGALVCAEALLRWAHPRRGLIMPDAFIPLAEETGLIADIGRLALAAACDQARAWQRAGFEPVTIAVNLSPSQFEQDNLVDMVMECLVAANLDSHWLQLELTEAAILDRAEQAAVVLGRLRELGIRIAIDDFGTGYSSLIQLSRLPIDCLKIDREFVLSLPHDADTTSVLEAMVALGRKLNMTLVAEGVETLEQLACLKELGCPRCQGYLFGAPVAAPEFEKFLTIATGADHG